MAETPTIPSEGEWRYSFKCRDCGLRFSRRPTQLPVGPLLETRRGILADDSGTIPLNEEVRVYTASVLDLQCPDCLLRPFFPVRISEALWEKWCSEQATTIESDPILRAYVALARRYDDGTVGYTAEAVVACFRCNGQLLPDDSADVVLIAVKRTGSISLDHNTRAPATKYHPTDFRMAKIESPFRPFASFLSL